jgi:tetratricopeptide (TPR) repeat protein
MRRCFCHLSGFYRTILTVFIPVMLVVILGSVSPSQASTEAAEKHKALGNLYYTKHLYTKAIQEFTHAIQEDPDFMAAYFNRGLTYYDLQLYYKAIVDFDMVIMLNPDDDEAYLNRGLCYSKVDKLKLALTDITKSSKLGNHDAKRILERGEISKRIEKSRQKQRIIKDIMDENPDTSKRTVKVLNANNEFGGNTIMSTYAKDSPSYTGSEGIFRQIDYYDINDRLKKTELFHTAAYISAKDTNKTTIWYDDKTRITKKEFVYTGKLLNHTGVQYFDERGNMTKQALVDKHGKEVSVRTFP